MAKTTAKKTTTKTAKKTTVKKSVVKATKEAPAKATPMKAEEKAVATPLFAKRTGNYFYANGKKFRRENCFTYCRWKSKTCRFCFKKYK